MSIASDKLSPGLGGVPETLLIPLWARAIEQQHADPILIDPSAVEIVDRLDYDFNTFKRQNVAVENFCVRASVIDDVVRSVLRQRPGTPVVEFGPGLDTRYDRIGSLASAWLEVDLPEVVRLRRSFFEENDHRRITASSMLDSSWHEACADFKKPPLFVAEGVFYFFSADQIARLFRDLGTRFPGARFVFDAVSPEFLKLSNWQHPLKDSRLQFSLKPYARELTEWAPLWQVDRYVGFGDSPWYDRSMHRFPLWKRTTARWLPWGRHAFMVVQAGVRENTQHSSRGDSDD